MGGGGEIASAFVRIRPEMKGFQGEVHSGVRSAFGGVGKIVTGALVGAAAATGAVGAGLVASAKSAITFEKSMRNVNSIAMLGEAQFKSLGGAVTGMAAEVGQKPKVLADGLYDLVSSGFKANDAIKVLKVSARAATAGLTDAATASGAVAAALNAYHMGADKARKVSDILFQTVNKGVLTFEELAQNMGDLVPAAAPLGISLEEVGASMSTITLQGVPAAEAATRVKNAMLQIATPSKGLSKLLKQNGFESGAAAIKALGFSGVLTMLSKATGGNVDELAKLLPEMRGMLGVVGLTGKNTAVYTANLKAMTEASKGAGITSKVFAEQSKSLAVQWDKFSARMDVFKVKIGTALIPSLGAALDHLNKFFTKLDNAKGTKAKLTVVWEEVSSLATALADRIRQAISMIDWQAVWATAVGMADALTTKIGDAVALVDWGLVWGQAAGIAEALAARFEEIDWSSVGRAIGDGIAASVAQSTQSAKKLGDAIGRIFRSIDWVPIGKAMGPGIAAALATAFVTLMDPAFWTRNWDLALAIALVVFRVRIFKVFAPLGRYLGTVLAKVWDDAILAVAGVIERLSPRLAQAVLKGLVALPAMMGVLLSKLLGVVSAQFGRLGKIAQFTVRVLGVGAILDSMTHLAAWVGGKILDIVRYFASLPGLIIAAIPNPYGLLVGIGISIIDGLWSGLKAKAGEMLSWVGGLGGKIKSLKGPEEKDKKLLEPEGKAIILGLETGMMASWDSLAPKINALGSNIIRNMILGISATEPQFKGKLAQAASAALQRAREVVSKSQGVVSDAFSRLGANASKAFEAATNAHLTTMQGRFDAKIKRLVTGPLDKALAAIEARTNKALAALDIRADVLTPAEKALSDFEASRTAAEDAAKRAALAGREAALIGPVSVTRNEGDTDAEFAQKQLEAEQQRASDLADVRAEIANQALDDQQRQLEKAAEASRVARDKEIEAARVAIETRAEADRVAAEAKFTKLQERYQREYDTQVLNYTSERDLQAEHLGTMLTALQERLKLHPEEWKKINAKVQALFKNAFGPEYQTAGKNLGSGFAKGIRESFGEVRAAANDLAAILAKYLPHSPAELGPLSKPINWKGYLTDGLKPGMVSGAIAAALATGGLASVAGGVTGSGTPQITGALAPLGQLVSMQTEMLEELRTANDIARDGKTIQVAVDGVPTPTVNPNQIALAVRR